MISKEFKEHYEILNNLHLVRNHFNKFGITKEGLDLFNENNKLSNALNIDLYDNMNTVIVTEGLLDKINEIKDKLKEKWENFKKSFEKKKEVKLSELEKMLNSLEEIEDKISNIDFNKELIEAPTFKTIEYIVKFCIDFSKELSNRNLIKKHKSGMMWLDLSKFPEKAKVIKVGYTVSKATNGILLYPWIDIKKNKYKYYEPEIKNGSLNKLGWNEKNILEIIKLFKIVFKELDIVNDTNGITNSYEVYGRNMEIIDKFDSDNDPERFEELIELSYDADEGIDTMQDIYISMEKIIINIEKLLSNSIKRSL